MPNAKIVCTTGPATSSLAQIRKMVGAGMDVVRINRSHGSPEEHEKIIQRARQVSEETGHKWKLD